MSYTKKIGRHYGNLMQNLNRQRRDGKFCDITVRIQKDRFHAHKCILAAASKKLQYLIGKCSKNDENELIIESLSPHGFKIVLEYIYTSSLWIPAEFLSDVSNAAIFLEMDDLIQSCLAFDYPQTAESSHPKDVQVTTFPNNEGNSLSVSQDYDAQDNDDIAADLMHNKLPELDSSLGGLLDPENDSPSTGIKKTSRDYAELPPDTANSETTGNFGTYPDQDALSEISVQNDGPTEEDLMYQLPVHEMSSGPAGIDYSYMHYGRPPLDQGFSSRHIPKMLHHSNMPLIPGIMPPSSFQPDQNQYQMGGYFASQPSINQYYTGNMSMPNNHMQEQDSRNNYDIDVDDTYTSLQSQNYSPNDMNKRPFTSYGNDVSSSQLTPQSRQSVQDISSASYPYRSGDKSAKSYQPNVENSNRAYSKAQFDSNNFMNNQQINSNTHSRGLFHNSKMQNDIERGHVITDTQLPHKVPTNTTSSDSYQNAHEHSLTNESEHDKSMDEKAMEVLALFASSKKDLPSSSESTVGQSYSVSNTTQEGASNSGSHFTSRPAARMPPKKAGYRGIESDYNREFNTGVKSNIVGQYDNLANVVDSPNSRSQLTHGTDHQTLISKENDFLSNSSEILARKDHDQTNYQDNLQEKSNFYSERSEFESTSQKVSRKDNVHDFYLTKDPFPETNTYEKINSPYQEVSHNKRGLLSYETQPFQGTHDSEFYDFPNVPIEHVPSTSHTNQPTRDTGNNHAPLLSPISTQSLDIAEYDSRDRDFNTFNPNFVPIAAYDTASHFNSFVKSINTTPTKGTQFESLYSHLEDYFRDNIHSQSPSKIPQGASNNSTGGSVSNHSTPNVTSALYVNTTENTAPVYTNISPCPDENEDTMSNSMNFPTQHLSSSFSSSLEDVRKNILNVLIQEKFDDNLMPPTTPIVSSQTDNPPLPESVVEYQDKNDEIIQSRKSINSPSLPSIEGTNITDLDNNRSVSEPEHGESAVQTEKEREEVPLNQLYQLEPFGRSEDVIPHERSEQVNLDERNSGHQMENHVAGQGANQLLASAPMPQFEDIDSDTCSESNARLVIDIDSVNQRHKAKPAQSNSSATDSATQNEEVRKKVEGNQRQKRPATKTRPRSSNAKGGKGILRNERQIDETVNRNVPGSTGLSAVSNHGKGIVNHLTETNGEQSNHGKGISNHLPESNGEQSNHNTNSDNVNMEEDPERLKIPKYSITTEYKEAAEKNSNVKSDGKIKKPLKKRIKLTLNMTKIQDDTVIIDDTTTPSSHISNGTQSTQAKPTETESKPTNRRLKYTCELCGREFWERYGAFAEHMQAHSRGSLHHCSVCGVGYQRMEDLTRHRNTAHALQAFSCVDCGVRFTNAQLYRKHCMDVHNNKKPFRCLYARCTFTCARLNVLERHTLIHGTEKQFMCAQCGKKFAQPNGLRHHLLSCMNMQQFTCSQCPKTFNRVQSLREHEAIHTGARKYACTECDATFTDQRNLKRHARKHSNELPYACTHCSDKFKYSNVLKRHLVSKHQHQVEKGKKGSRNKDSVLVKNYTANTEVVCS